VRSDALRSVAGLACVLAGTSCDVLAPSVADFTDVRVVEVGPLVHEARIALDRPASVTVRYGPPGGPFLEVHGAGARTEHSVLLARLRPNTTFDYTVSAGASVVSGAFTTGGVDGDLAALTFEVQGGAVHPLTLLEINDADRFHGAAIVDAAGAVVWYFRTVGALTGSTVRANGDFVFVDLEAGLVEVTPSGAVVATLPQAPERTIHHDVLETADGRLLFLTTDPRELGGQTIVGDAIWEWRPGTDAVRRWSSFDHLSPDLDWGTRSRPTDWLHANSLSLGPRGNYVVSLNFLNQILSISPDFTELEWRLGGVNATVAVPADGVFSGQHTAAELPGGHVLMFDNGIERAEPFSRGLELEIVGDRATVFRDYRPNPGNWSRAISSVFRTADGLTLILYGLSAGAAGSTGPIEAYAYDGTGGPPRWRLGVSAQVFSVYRATPLWSIAGESGVP